ncbi:protein SCO1 [Acidiphilium sp. MT5]
MLYDFLNGVTFIPVRFIRRNFRWIAVLAALGAINPARAATSAPLLSPEVPATQIVVPITGLAPPLRLTMTDASTGKRVTAADFRGKVVMLYFGYTNCPDVCPDTLGKIHQIFLKLQQKYPSVAAKTVFLFVTVDPKRDGLALLHRYLALFDPHMIGLRGGPNALYRLTRRYRVVASVHPSANPEKYQVTHSALVYVFGLHGNARFIIPELGLNPHPDYAALVNKLQQLTQSKQRDGLLTALARFN